MDTIHRMHRKNKTAPNTKHIRYTMCLLACSACAVAAEPPELLLCSAFCDCQKLFSFWLSPDCLLLLQMAWPLQGWCPEDRTVEVMCPLVAVLAAQHLAQRFHWPVGCFGPALMQQQLKTMVMRTRDDRDHLPPVAFLALVLRHPPELFRPALPEPERRASIPKSVAALTLWLA